MASRGPYARRTGLTAQRRGVARSLCTPHGSDCTTTWRRAVPLHGDVEMHVVRVLSTATWHRAVPLHGDVVSRSPSAQRRGVARFLCTATWRCTSYAFLARRRGVAQSLCTTTWRRAVPLLLPHQTLADVEKLIMNMKKRHGPYLPRFVHQLGLCYVVRYATTHWDAIENESVPIQLPQCWFLFLAGHFQYENINVFSNKIIRKQFCQAALGNCHGLKLP